MLSGLTVHAATVRLIVAWVKKTFSWDLLKRDIISSSCQVISPQCRWVIVCGKAKTPISLFILFSSFSLWFKSHLGEVIAADPVNRQELTSAHQNIRLKTGAVNPRCCYFAGSIFLFFYFCCFFHTVPSVFVDLWSHQQAQKCCKCSTFDLFLLMYPSGKEVNGECGGNMNDAIDGIKLMLCECL